MYVDTTIFMYAIGAESPWKEPCVEVLRAGVREDATLVTSAETLQEILHRCRSIGRGGDIRRAFDLVVASMRSIFPVSLEDVDEARRLGERLAQRGTAGGRVRTARDAADAAPAAGTVSARDLVHAAVARRHGVREVITVDVRFALIPGMVVIDPRDWPGLCLRGG